MADSMSSAIPIASRHLAPRPSLGVLMCLPLLLSLAGPVVGSTYVSQEPATGEAPEDLWSDEYVAYEFPWGGDAAVQFKEYHTYETMRNRMLRLAEDNAEFVAFHEGLNGGTNARGQQTNEDTYKGWYYGHPSPWLKITGDIGEGDYNAFNGDTGNYADREDILIVGNHHAREWMSYEVPMFMIETLVWAYNNIGYDNDGDGLVDEDPWGDADGDGIIDDDGDCLRLDPSFQDSDGDGTPCGPGDLGVDEDFSEQKLHDLINAREIYIVPMLNVDGNRYDREVYCGPTAWENCATSGWRKNLRDNTVTGVTPIPDLDEEVDESCDGVDLNRNYQFEWGAPLGATGPLFPGMCYVDDGPNNDVYNGPVDTVDQDGDGRLNEDGVDGKDDDSDGLVDEDWLGGNSEPETKFIQDLTEMNDDLENGGSDFPAVLTWHSFSELILYPWGHCQGCTNPDQDQLKYHGDVMATMSNYENMQSSSLYPTSGDFCDWHYGLFMSYCYTMEIGNAFHERPENIDDILLRNVGMGMYMIEIADNPRERADLAIANISQQNYLKQPSKLTIPESGDIPIDMCVSDQFPYSVDETSVKWRQVKPSRMQSDFGPREWSTTPWQVAEVVATGTACPLAAGNGTTLRAMLPISETATGQIHYKAMVSTLSGADFYQYPADGGYYTLDISYRAAFGSVLGALFMFTVVAGFVWGGLAVALRIMVSDNKDKVYEDDLRGED